MFRCKIIDFLFRIFPVKFWQDYLIRRHIQECRDCADKLANVEETKALLVQESEVEGLEGIWPAVRDESKKEERAARLSLWPRLRWAVGAAAMVTVVVIGIWIYSILIKKVPLEEPFVEKFKVNYINIENRPAKAYVYQPHGSDMIIVWAEKTL